MTTVATEQGFMADILANVKDDVPRLIFADWLEEHGGDPQRAEFIRVQVKLDKIECDWSKLDCCWDRRMDRNDVALTGCRSCQAAIPLLDREHALFRDVRPTGLVIRNCLPWSGDLPKILDVDHPLLRLEGGMALGSGSRRSPPCSWSFRRGFVAEIECAAADWVKHGNAIRACQPIESVRLKTMPRWGVDVWQHRPVQFYLIDDPAGWRIDRSELQASDIENALLCRRWPGIAFHLPPSPPVLLGSEMPTHTAQDWEATNSDTPLADFRRVLRCFPAVLHAHRTGLDEAPEGHETC